MSQSRYSPPVEPGASVHTQPFNHRLSIMLDVIIIAMEAEEHGLRRRAWRLVKRALETQVPAFYGTSGGAR